jgi:hypothetical protein
LADIFCGKWMSLCAGQKDVEQKIITVIAHAMKQSPPWREGDRFVEKHRLAMTYVQGGIDDHRNG